MLEDPFSQVPFPEAVLKLFWGGQEHYGLKSSPDNSNVQPKFRTAGLVTVVSLNRMTLEKTTSMTLNKEEEKNES